MSQSPVILKAENVHKSYRMGATKVDVLKAVSYTHLRAHETVLDLVCRLLLEKKKIQQLS